MNKPKRDYAVLIPTRTRPKALIKLFTKCPMLNSEHTYVGIEPCEVFLYQPFLETLGDKVRPIPVKNPLGYTAVAREALRKAATESYRYNRYVSIDDNCLFTETSLRSLLAAQFHTKGIIFGTNQVEEFYKKEVIQDGSQYLSQDGFEVTIYSSVSTVYLAIPDELYREYSYPPDACLDDIHFLLWCVLRKQFDNIKGCKEARYVKHRFEAGGTGTGNERAQKTLLGMARLAKDFPEIVDHTWIRLRIPWKHMLESVS